MRTWIRSIAITVLWAQTGWNSARGDEKSSPASWPGTLQQADGQQLPGKVLADSGSGVRFAVDGRDSPLRLAKGAVVHFEGPGPDPTEASPPFRVELGLGRRISGRLGSVDATQIHLVGSSTGTALDVARRGALSLSQRVGEMQLIDDGFERLSGTQWTLIGDPEIIDQPRLAGAHSLRIPAGGTSVTRRLEEPVASGRLELAFHDKGSVEPGQQWFVDLQFRGPVGPETVRVILGWAEESHSVESPGGPALAVQRLARRAGWHRLSLRFGPNQTRIGVDGNELAHGKGPGGPLVEIRLASHTAGRGAEPQALAGFVDDLRLVRFAESGSALEVDPSQDAIQLSGGDQVFGTVVQADANRIQLRVDQDELQLPWSEVSSLQFHRVPDQSKPIDGTWLRLEWRAAPGDDPLDLDRVDGALVGLDDRGLALEVPYVGRVTIARGRLRRLEVLGRSQRIVIDATPHHLGDEPVEKPLPLDPPQSEGRVLQRSFELGEIPNGPAFLSLDVVQVAGEANGLPFSDLVKKGELRTTVSINQNMFDYINRHISSNNDSPERIDLAIPAGLLHPGANTVRFEQTGKASDPNSLDDLGILEISVAFPHEQAKPSVPDKP